MKEIASSSTPEVPGPETARNVLERPPNDPGDRFGSERLEDDDLAARQERAVQLEGGVLGRRADQDDVARLDVREEDVLLRPVEAVDLVEEEGRTLSRLRSERPRALEHLPHLLDAGRDRRVREEPRRGAGGDQPRERRLADAGRPPEHERGNAVLRDRAGEETVGADDVVRALDLVERARAHAVGERHLPRRLPTPRAPAVRDRRGARSSRFEPLAAAVRADGDGLASPPAEDGEPAVDPRPADGVPDHLRLGSAPGSPPPCRRAAGEKEAQHLQDPEKEEHRDDDEGYADHDARRVEMRSWIRSRSGISRILALELVEPLLGGGRVLPVVRVKEHEVQERLPVVRVVLAGALETGPPRGETHRGCGTRRRGRTGGSGFPAPCASPSRRRRSRGPSPTGRTRRSRATSRARGSPGRAPPISGSPRGGRRRRARPRRPERQMAAHRRPRSTPR